MPYGREDDGRFTRDGYVLLGYSTDPDGSGELILPGHKYKLDLPKEMQMVLYCVWQKASDASNFTY